MYISENKISAHFNLSIYLFKLSYISILVHATIQWIKILTVQAYIYLLCGYEKCEFYITLDILIKKRDYERDHSALNKNFRV